MKKKKLTNPQMATIILAAARPAYDYKVARGEIVGIDFDTWRREEVERAVGRHGLRECDNSHFNKLIAHFSSLAGEDGRAMNALLRDQTEPKRQAEAVLLRELSKAGLPPAYAEKIARDKFRCSVLDCDARHIWQLVYTVRNRSKAKRRATPNPEPGTPNPEPASLHDSTL